MASDGRYEIEFTDNASNALRGLSPKNLRLVSKKINQLAGNPRPRKSEKLEGYDNAYRVRAGSYRICYSIEDGRLTVLILAVGDRKEVYRDFKDYMG